MDKKTFRSIFMTATRDPYSFLWIKLNSKGDNDMFKIRFEYNIELEEDTEEEESE